MLGLLKTARRIAALVGVGALAFVGNVGYAGAQQQVTTINRIANYSASDLCVDTPGGSTQNGVQMWVVPCSGATSQSFTYVQDATGWGYLQNQQNGKCMQDMGRKGEYSWPVRQQQCDNGSDQLFQFRYPPSSGYAQIVNKKTENCVALDSAQNPYRLFTWGCTFSFGYNQLWVPS